ncbi:MAG: hypothetical protein AAB583_00870, partial [Patescibacteria group bacterium]
NIGECRNYCQDPIHRADCISFAKQKGFNKEDKLQKDQPQILSQARKELGCGSIEVCQVFCQKKENFDKCDTFSQKTGIAGGFIKNPAQRQIVQKAEESLGCNSSESCKEFCEEEDNKDKCSDFANKIGLLGGEKRVGPGGCSSEDTCKRFCQLNPQACRPFQQPGGDYKGPQASPSYENADDRARFCREFPEKCLVFPTPTPQLKLTGSDGTWCFDSDKALDQTFIRNKGYCQDQNGSYEDFCADSIYVRDYYCTGTWDGKSLSKVHCAPGGYSCTSYLGSGCSDGGCNPPAASGSTDNTSGGGSSSQIKASPTSIPSLDKNPVPTSSPQSSSTSVSGQSPTPSQNPAPTSAPSPSPNPSQGDGSFCEDSDEGGNNYYISGSCKDAQGTHTDYCDGETVRDYYCTGTWSGSSWSNKHCAAGGFVCSSAGNTCSNGACTGSVQGTKTQKNIFQMILDWIKK